MKKNYVISAAGGNNTAISIIDSVLTREKYEEIGSKLLEETERRGVEQVGFLIPSIRHFEMSGGEFCGNAARSAAFLFSKIFGMSEFDFTISGFDGKVEAIVTFDQNDSTNAIVSCYFNGMVAKVLEKKVGTKNVSIVDLGGIVHCVLLNEAFPKDSFRKEHFEIITELNLRDRLAVGVLWLNKVENGLKMDPVVWVKSIDTFFYETSCGSGSIASAIATGASTILQPTGQSIRVDVDDGGVKLTSDIKEEISYNDFSFLTLDKESKMTKTFSKGFCDLYKLAFSEAPYFESYTEEWIIENVWNKHLKDGVIVLALEDQNVIGLSCSIPLLESTSPLEFIKSLVHKPFNFEKAIYMSELAVHSKFRNLGIGSKLVKERLKWAKTEGYEYFVMRTASIGSNSFNLYKRIGVNEIEEKQNVKDISTEVESASDERIYLYGSL